MRAGVALLLAPVALLAVSCRGEVNRKAEADGYVFYDASIRHDSKGVRIGYIADTVEIDGVERKFTIVTSGAYRAGGDIYFAGAIEGYDPRYLCYCKAGESKCRLLMESERFSFSFSYGRNPYSSVFRFSSPGTGFHYVRGGEFVDVDEGDLISPEGDGRLVEGEQGWRYVEGDESWELPGFAKRGPVNGWMLYYLTSEGDCVAFDMRSKALTELEGEFPLLGTWPFTIRQGGNGLVCCYLGEDGRVEERDVGIDLPLNSVSIDTDGHYFRISASRGREWIYDYAFDRLTPATPGVKSGVFEGDFSYYEDEDYRFYMKCVYDEDRSCSSESYHRLDKRTGKDEFLYRPGTPVVGRYASTVFPNLMWVVPPEK